MAVAWDTRPNRIYLFIDPYCSTRQSYNYHLERRTNRLYSARFLTLPLSPSVHYIIISTHSLNWGSIQCCTYVHVYMAVTLKDVGMLQIPCTWVSGRPLKFDLPQGKHKVFNLQDQWMSVWCLQGLQNLHHSFTHCRRWNAGQGLELRLGCEQAGPSALSELGHQHVELNSEHSRKFRLHFLKLTLAMHL